MLFLNREHNLEYTKLFRKENIIQDITLLRIECKFYNRTYYLKYNVNLKINYVILNDM